MDISNRGAALLIDIVLVCPAAYLLCKGKSEQKKKGGERERERGQPEQEEGGEAESEKITRE